jgi:hypothetical protein
MVGWHCHAWSGQHVHSSTLFSLLSFHCICHIHFAALKIHFQISTIIRMFSLMSAYANSSTSQGSTAFFIMATICLFGTTDNYNMEQTKHLHIEFLKKAYDVTNQKDEYPQMTTWVRCCEKVQAHTACVKWQQHNPTCSQTSTPIEHLNAPCFLKLT